MAEVKWIKLATNVFDNRKIRQIEILPDGDTLIVIWLKMLCLAGSINDSGFLYFTKEIPYTDQMLSTQFNVPLPTIQLALHTFEQFGMIDIVDDVLLISNWEKYQNIETLDKIREQTRNRVAKYRENQKLISQNICNVTSNATVTECNATDKEEDKDKELDKDKKSVRETTLDIFNRLKSNFSFSDYLTEKIEEWLKYKMERKEGYKEQGLKALLRQIENNQMKYGDTALIKVIDLSMASGWKGIIFDKLDKPSNSKQSQDFYDAWRNA